MSKQQITTERDKLAAKIRWASRHSTTAEQARDAADALMAAGYREHHPEVIGDAEIIGPGTTRLGDQISHNGVIYHAVEAAK